MGKNPFTGTHRTERVKPLAEWEKKTIPEFYWDGEDHVWWRCPHMMNFEMLDNSRWKIIKPEPLTVKPSIHNLTCGCHGFIDRGRWVPASTPIKKEETNG